MKNRALAVYFIILFLLCATVVVGARMLGQQGAYLAQGYRLRLSPQSSRAGSFLYYKNELDILATHFQVEQTGPFGQPPLPKAA